jgi:hypothetical protein
MEAIGVTIFTATRVVHTDPTITSPGHWVEPKDDVVELGGAYGQLWCLS